MGLTVLRPSMVYGGGLGSAVQTLARLAVRVGLDHLPVLRFVTPERFAQFEREALAMGFKHAACGPMVRSSYHADQQAAAV